jgi:hypothetical protein
MKQYHLAIVYNSYDQVSIGLELKRLLLHFQVFRIIHMNEFILVICDMASLVPYALTMDVTRAQLLVSELFIFLKFTFATLAVAFYQSGYHSFHSFPEM